MANIRWRTKDIEELRKEIDRYNKKIKRLQKQGRSSDIFEPSLPFKDVKAGITTRAEYNDYLSHLRNLTKRTSTYKYKPATEKGVSLTQGEAAEINRRVKVINKDRRQMKREYEERTQSKIKDLPKHDITRIALSPKSNLEGYLNHVDKLKGSKTENIKKYIESVKKQSEKEYREERYDNYKKKYIESAGRILGWNNAIDIENRLEKVDSKEFYYASLTYDEFALSFLYNDPLTAAEKVEAILSRCDYLGW